MGIWMASVEHDSTTRVDLENAACGGKAVAVAVDETLGQNSCHRLRGSDTGRVLDIFLAVSIPLCLSMRGWVSVLAVLL